MAKRLKYLTLLTVAIFSFSYLIADEDDHQQQLVDAIVVYPATPQPVMEQNVFNLINQQRVANGLPALLWSNTVGNYAREHSMRMASKVVPFGHDGVDLRYSNLKAAIPSIKRFGENVAYNYGYSTPGLTAVNGWLRSPGHFANIIGDFNYTGVGIATSVQGEYFFTQIFIKASPPVSLTSFDESLGELENLEGTLIQTVCSDPIFIE